jgi:hypothetical protein
VDEKSSYLFLFLKPRTLPLFPFLSCFFSLLFTHAYQQKKKEDSPTMRERERELELERESCCMEEEKREEKKKGFWKAPPSRHQ